MKDRIIIKKDLIPYFFNISLGDTMFGIEVKYNKREDLFTAALYRDGKSLCHGEAIIYGMPLFNDIHDYDFPAIIISPVDEAGESFEVTYDNFNKTVFLCINDEGRRYE